MLPRPTPHWALLAFQAVGQALDDFTSLPFPARPTPNSLSKWFNISSTRLTLLLTSHAPGRRPCPRSKPWWSPRLSSLKREYHMFARMSGLDPSHLNWSNVKSLRRTYFKAIAWAKQAHWSDFLLSATLHSLWTAKRFAFGHLPQRFPDLPGATDPSEVAEKLLHHFSPPKPPPHRLHLPIRHGNYTALTSEEISRALAKYSNTSAPGPNHIPYLVWKSVHRLKPSLLPSLLDPLLAHGFTLPPSKGHLVSSLTNRASPPTTHLPPSGSLSSSGRSPRSLKE